VLGAVAVALLFFDAPGHTTLPVAVPWLLAGLGLRAVAFRHLGGQGRTRDPSPPSGHVVTGPYSRLEHPVYVANLLIAAGLVFAMAPPDRVAAAGLIIVTGLYVALAARESEQLRSLPIERRAPRTWPQVARSERSTWLTVGVVLLLAFG